MTPDTVPLADHLALARLVAAMRRAQRAYFAAKRAAPHCSPDLEWRAARSLEKSVDAAVADALARDRQTLPGLGAEGGGL